MRIVVGIDGSPSSAAALRWAAQQASAHDGDITVVTAYRFPLAFVGSGADPAVAAPDAQHEAQTVQQSMIDAAAEQLRGLEVAREIADYEGGYRLCFVRAPEGFILGLAQELSGASAASGESG